MFSVFIPDPSHSLDRKFNLTNWKIEVVAAQLQTHNVNDGGSLGDSDERDVSKQSPST